MINKNKKGFTLVELLVVISIIGLLSTIAVVSLGSARAKARDTKRIADVKQITTALEQYYADQGNYWASAASGAAASGLAIGTATADSLTATNGFAAAPGAGTTYMGKVPAYPGTAAATCTATAAGTPPATYIANYCYYTTVTSAASDYILTVKLEATNPAAGITGTNCRFTSSGMTCS